MDRLYWSAVQQLKRPCNAVWIGPVFWGIPFAVDDGGKFRLHLVYGQRSHIQSQVDSRSQQAAVASWQGRPNLNFTPIKEFLLSNVSYSKVLESSLVDDMHSRIACTPPVYLDSAIPARSLPLPPACFLC